MKLVSTHFVGCSDVLVCLLFNLLKHKDTFGSELKSERGEVQTFSEHEVQKSQSPAKPLLLRMQNAFWPA